MKEILIVLVIIVLGVGAYLFLKPGGLSKLPMPGASQQSTKAAAPTEVEVPLHSQNNSDELGTAVLTEKDGKLMVTVNIKGEPAGASQPAHIHVGACPNPGKIAYPLTSVVNGKSETVVSATLADIKKMLPMAINVHKSQSEMGVYL